MFNSKFGIGVLKHPGYNGKSSSPPPPDYTGAAQATAAGNLDAARATAAANKVNQVTPYGNLTYTANPTKDAYGNTLYTATTTLSPAQQQILNQQNTLNSGLLGTAQSGLTYANQVLSSPGVDMSALPAIDSSAMSNLPALQSNVNGGQYATGYGVQNATGNVANPSLQTSTGANQLAGGTVNNPNVASGLNLAGNPKMLSSINSAGNIQNAINTSGLPSYGIDPGQTYSDAIMKRLQPQIAQQSAQSDAQLANQGIARGTEAYNNAKRDLTQGQNDMLTSAIINGMNTGLQANQQQFGQNAAQQAAINNAQAQGFGQNAQQASFQNAANQQGYNQALGLGQFYNQAAGQQFGQNLSAQQLANQAANQNNALAQSNAQFANQAANTQFGQNLSAQQLANQAAAQNTGNAANLAAFQNQAVGQQFNQGLANAQLGNQANLQGFNQQLQNAQLQNTAQQQGFTQAAYNQMQPINVINALRSGTQVTSPQFTNTPLQAQTAGPDLLGAASQGYNAQLGAVNANNAATGNFMGGLMGLGGAIFSDRRLKKNIKKIGEYTNGLGLYIYDYVWGQPSVGVMADEVEAIMPEAVIMTASGFKAVNYDML